MKKNTDERFISFTICIDVGAIVSDEGLICERSVTPIALCVSKEEMYATLVNQQIPDATSFEEVRKDVGQLM